MVDCGVLRNIDRTLLLKITHNENVCSLLTFGIRTIRISFDGHFRHFPRKA